MVVFGGFNMGLILVWQDSARSHPLLGISYTALVFTRRP